MIVHEDNKKTCIALEGVPGSYKTFTFNALRKKYKQYKKDIVFLGEKLHKMSNLSLNTLEQSVKLFDSCMNTNEISMETLQHHIINTVYTSELKFSKSITYKKCKIVIMDRHLQSSKVFIEHYSGTKKLTAASAKVLNNRLNILKNMNKLLAPTILLYFHVNPKIGIKLVHKRGRKVEKTYITKKYLSNLHLLHKKIFGNLLDHNTKSLSHICDIINKKLQLTTTQIEELPKILDIRNNMNF